MTMTRKEEFRKQFLIKYKSAIKAKLTREQLAHIMGMQPASLVRRRLAIQDETGVNLPQLKSVVGSEDDVCPDRLKRFGEYVDEMEKSSVRQKLNVDEISSVDFPEGTKRFVITSAQNATPVHENFLASLLNYCDVNNAQLIVIPYRYKNPTSIWSANNQEDEWWHPSVENFIVDKEIDICDSLTVLGKIKLQPTAINPLSGFDSYTGTKSAIFGHPKVQLKTVPTPSKRLPKILSTTGAVTVPNYTDSKAGHKGEFHHSLSAIILELEDDTFHLRHVHGDDITGNFYDLDAHYTTNDVSYNHRVASLITGDTHAEFIDTKVKNATYLGDDSMVGVLRPETLIWHDVEDFYARNHHHRNNDIIAYGKHHFGRNNVEESLQLTADLIDECSREEMLNVIVKSNHDEALDRWLREASGKDDPENDRFYHYMKYHQYVNVQRTENGFATIDPFQFWCKNPDNYTGLKNLNNTVFLKRDESFVVNDVELGFHGDMGLNGGRGSIQAFSKIGPKVVIGHSHSPGIYEGAYQVGVSAMINLEYAKGASGWLHTHCVIYPDGSRTLINIVDGKWKANFE